MAATQRCREEYLRVLTGSKERIQCTYIDGHSSEHSFRTLMVQDETDKTALEQRLDLLQPDGDKSALAIVRNIEEGKADPYLEAILSAAHNRKRALRGVRLFPDLNGGRR